MTMKTLIFCGGQGTRIRGVMDNIPKPMLPIGDRPVLWHIMSIYAAYGYKDFVLCLGQLSWQIKEYFLNYRVMTEDFKINLSHPKEPAILNYGQDIDWNIIFAETGEDVQTGARIKKISNYIKDDDLVMVTYGDGVSDIDIGRLVTFHKSHNKIGTITGVRPIGRFGEIGYDSKGLVNQFNEKPQVTEGRINGGFMVFNTKKMLAYIPDGDNVIFEQDPMRRMASDGELMMYPHDGFWQPMDTFREYKLLNDIWHGGIVPWKK